MIKQKSPLLLKLISIVKQIKPSYFLIIVLIFFVFENCILLYDNLQNKTTILGLKLENKNLTGLQRQQIEGFIHQESDKRNIPLIFTNGNKTYQLLPSEVGYKVDEAYLTNKLLQVGRTGNFFDKFIVQQRALFGMENTKISGTFSQSLLLLQIALMQETFDQNPQVETLDFAHNNQAVIPAKDGTKIHLDKLTNAIITHIANPPLQPLSVPTYIAFSRTHAPQELDPIRNQIATLVNTPISITSNNKTLTFTLNDLQSMLTVVERPDPNNSGKTKLVLRLDDKQLSQRIGLFAAPIEAQTHAEFNDEDAKVAILSQFFSGKRRIIDIPTGQNLAHTYVLGASTQKGINQQPTLQTTNQSTPKIAYLTFDDGPNTIYHPMILDILKTYNIKATFFLVGQNVQRDTDIAKRTVAEGHLIGDHSLTHSFLPKLSSDSITNELQATNVILKPINNNKDITLFRPPYGAMNYTVKTNAHNLGLKIFLWDVDPQDWSEPASSELVRRVVSATHDGSTILMHSNHLATVRALPKILETLQSEGFTFRTLDQYPKPEEG